MCVLFNNEVLAKEKADEFLKSMPAGFEYAIQKQINSEKYFIAGFFNSKLNIHLSFMDDKWFGRHASFDDVFSCQDCPTSAIKHLRQSLLKKIAEYEDELKKMKESKDQDWFYDLNGN